MSPAVEEFLRASEVIFKIHKHEPIVSFADAKEKLSFDPDFMVKGLAFRIANARLVIIGMRASDRADYKKIADALNISRTDLRAAAPDNLVSVDMMPGGVVPLPINGAEILFDREVLNMDTIYCGTGRTDTTLEIAASDLVRIAGGRVVEWQRADDR